MRSEYDFSNSVQNPYAKKNKTQVTIRLENGIIDYFKKEATRTGIPYQNLINLYLSQCVQEKRSVKFS